MVDEMFEFSEVEADAISQEVLAIAVLATTDRMAARERYKQWIKPDMGRRVVGTIGAAPGIASAIVLQRLGPPRAGRLLRMRLDGTAETGPSVQAALRVMTYHLNGDLDSAADLLSGVTETGGAAALHEIAVFLVLLLSEIINDPVTVVHRV